ncbi:unnamed protein product [Oppiella nova]|uniref:Uncharacterized protein n=1 Tax=Oppiella nova TaxID=334625 RepID=A0A7R9M714_9ACAR|nr:unnamed protein product [Oppiella nova]CAG2171942.1 unnamed protein product [Oppiella nova]
MWTYFWRNLILAQRANTYRGLIISILGPALNDLRVKLNTTIGDISFVFLCIFIGYTIGAIVNGIIFNYINRQLVLACLMIAMAITVAVLPVCPNITVLFAMAGICGHGCGGLDTALVVWLVEVWGNKSSLYLAGVQFFFAVGVCIAPLIDTPYLTDIPTNQTYTSSIINVSRLEVPFAINVSAILLLLLYCYRPYIPPKSQEKGIKFEFPKKWELIYILLGVFIIGPYTGLELMNFQLIPTFLQGPYIRLPEFTITSYTDRVYPSVYTFYESQLTLSNTTVGVFISAGGISTAIFPTICGQFIAAQPLALIYMNFILTIFF